MGWLSEEKVREELSFMRGFSAMKGFRGIQGEIQDMY